MTATDTVQAPPPAGHAAPPSSVKTGGRSMLTAILVRLAVVHVVSIYAGIFTIMHWLRDVPLLQSWIIGTVGFAMLFLAAGVMITGRALGYFSTPDRKFSLDWLPLLLIWPMGLSIWACLGMGLASTQARQEIADGMALPLLLLAATVPPLFLGRLPTWPTRTRLVHRLLEGHYALASLVAAVALFLAMQSALQAGAVPSAAPAAGTVAAAPSGAAAAPAARSSGFACDPSKTPQSGDDEEAEANQCPPPRGGVAAPAPAPSAPATGATGTSVTKSAKPIDQHFPSWTGIWMLVGGLLLVIARAVASRRSMAGAAGLAEAAATATGMLPGTPAQRGELTNRLVSAAGTQVAAQAGAWLRGSGIPNADLLADMMGKVLRPAANAASATGQQPTAAPSGIEAIVAAALPVASATPPAAPPAPMPPAVPPPPPEASPAPGEPAAAPAPATAPDPVSPPPAAAESTPTAAPPPPPPPAPPSADAEAAAKLRESVSDMGSALSKQQDATNELQSTVGTLQGQLEKQAEMMTQMVTEAQRSAEESRRTTDSLTRLMQGMKADLERLSRNQAEAG